MRSAKNTADRAESGAEGNDQRDQQTRRHAGDMVLHGEIQRQGVGKPDEAAERDEVEEHEPAAVGVAQQRGISFQRDRLALARRVLGREYVICEHHHHRNQQEAEHGLPAEMLGDRRCEHGIDHNAHVARAGDTHHDALILRRVPPARLGQRDGEGCAADAEHQAEDLNRKLAVEPVPPHPGVAAVTMSCAIIPVRLAPMISASTPIGTRSSAPARTGMATKVNFSLTAIHVVRDVDHQRAERDPGHEADVEIQERGQQCRPMASFLEFSKLHGDSIAIMRPTACARMRQVSAQQIECEWKRKSFSSLRRPRLAARAAISVSYDRARHFACNRNALTAIPPASGRKSALPQRAANRATQTRRVVLFCAVRRSAQIWGSR